MSDPIEWPEHEANCDCDECLRAEISRLRAEVEQWKDAANDLAGPIERVFELRALLREVLDILPDEYDDERALKVKITAALGKV